MTVQEIADEVGKTPQTVRKAVKACGFKLERGKNHTTNFNQKATDAIRKQLAK